MTDPSMVMNASNYTSKLQLGYFLFPDGEDDSCSDDFGFKHRAWNLDMVFLEKDVDFRIYSVL